MQASQYKGRSTGLGLAISRRIAAAHCGELGVQSNPGKGSRFFVRFPAAVSAPARAGGPPPQLVGSSGAAAGPGLVISTSAPIVDTGSGRMDSLGYGGVTFESPKYFESRAYA